MAFNKCSFYKVLISNIGIDICTPLNFDTDFPCTSKA
ncbi:hypothetical protein RSAG8_12261, partial [Rhizoctonia solani AG-8 WAC10335]